MRMSRNRNVFSSQPINDYDFGDSESSHLRGESIHSLHGVHHLKDVLDEDICDDPSNFFADIDNIIFEMQGNTSNRFEPNSIGMIAGHVVGTSQSKGKDGNDRNSDYISTDDEWLPKEEPTQIDSSYGSEKGAEANMDDLSNSGGNDPYANEGHAGDTEGEDNFLSLSYLKGKFFEYNKDGSCSSEPRLIFYDKAHFMEVLKDFSIFNGFDMFRFEHSRARFTAACSNSKECPWQIHASLLLDGVTFKIMTMNLVHT
ncbi:hypothetical protein Ancab_030856 [Ancistrocladus abbreviatus]